MSGSGDDTVSPGPDDEADLRPAPWVWAVIGLGWVVMAIAVFGAATDSRLGGFWGWGRWVVGAAVVHDLVVLPIVLGVGWILNRLLPASWRTPLRAALVVAAVVALSVWPIARRWGARADNPSILPLPVGRNLTLLVTTLVLAAVVAGAVAARRTRSGGPADPEEPA